MKTVARLITRGNENDGSTGTVDMILGLGMKSGTLKPCRIYEIREIMGELVIKDIGPLVDPKIWYKDATRVFIEDKHRFLTQEEYLTL